MTSICHRCFYTDSVITTGSYGSSIGTEKWVVFADGHPQLHVVDAKADYGVRHGP